MSSFRGHWNREGIDCPLSFCDGPSEFIPGQAMSVTELAARWRTGQLFTSVHHPIFDEDEFENASDFDEDMRVDPLTTVTRITEVVNSGNNDESYDQPSSYDGDDAAAPEEPQASIDVDNSETARS